MRFIYSFYFRSEMFRDKFLSFLFFGFVEYESNLTKSLHICINKIRYRIVVVYLLLYLFIFIYIYLKFITFSQVDHISQVKYKWCLFRFFWTIDYNINFWF
jgi:hypothetical protein